MFFRCANGSVYDFELTNDQRISREAVATVSLPHKVENRDAVTNRRQQTCAIGCEEKIASAVDGAQQVGELRIVTSGRLYNLRQAYLKVCLHVGLVEGICYRDIAAGRGYETHDGISQLFRDGGPCATRKMGGRD